MATVTHKRSPDEPEGGWLGPSGPGRWADLEELDLRQRGQLGPNDFNKLYQQQPLPADKVRPPWQK